MNAGMDMDMPVQMRSMPMPHLEGVDEWERAQVEQPSGREDAEREGS